MDSIPQMILTIVLSVIASSGFWAFLTTRLNRNDAKTELLMGMAHDRIVTLGMKYIERGYITKDEFENLHTYLYSPYLKNLKSNGMEDGSVVRIMESVCRLQIRGANYTIVDLQNGNK